MEAVVEAEQKGKVRYIGFTGHKSPEIHLKMLNTAFAHKFTLNTVQMPLNLMDAHYNSFREKSAARAGEAQHRSAGHEADG